MLEITNVSLSKCKKAYTRINLLKSFMGPFSIICPLFHPVKLIVYISSHLNKNQIRFIDVPILKL